MSEAIYQIVSVEECDSSIIADTLIVEAAQRKKMDGRIMLTNKRALFYIQDYKRRNLPLLSVGDFIEGTFIRFD